ncbi:uncharacterized protein TRIADDRAFT_24785 [Trichoplax adhaerens]|uniref:Protein phosphatase methylesterase 1 n=1 Tax=Trichoplax adhaerens TaxID=10228 RepID=B3RXN2_TRIAD|nr:hypothetical protein TRIADDRAFT_24785 [Trichoplax adhaerens]EDV24459.1 hypothetical protein TRIADDRAFT_24785 [Trichoplax adhaerens]|eukprot:XP_002112349.1 hypothetical protein TRIADDRAFT_24785 [Trichoplax adhaerens]
MVPTTYHKSVDRNTPSSNSGAIKKRRRDYSPLQWSDYFDQYKDVTLDNSQNVFRVYKLGTRGPVLYFLHGGGHSALSWALLAKALVQKCKVRIVAVDLRGHGMTRTDDDYNLSTETQISDIAGVHKELFDDQPPTVLVGHSMGGALAVHTAYKRLIPSLVGLVVIDVVEGTALDALSAMQNVLRNRPSYFNSIESAIEWNFRSGQTHNLESARVSVPAQLKICDNCNITTEVKDSNTIVEENEDADLEDASQPTSSRSDNTVKYTWVIDLCKTECYWREWFEELSSKFLACPGPKLLLLAGVDRLDKNLTIAQMQGKFQMQVLSQCGHLMQEDVPDKVANALHSFLIRNRIINTNNK